MSTNWDLKIEGKKLIVFKTDENKEFILFNQADYLENIDKFKRRYSKEFNDYLEIKNHFREVLDYRDKTELLNGWFKQLTPQDFKGFYIPIPIEETYFSMETQEFVKFKVHNYDDGLDYRQTGEIIVFDEELYQGKKFINHEKDWFWYGPNGEYYDHLYEKLCDYFTTDHFNSKLKELYKLLLEGKTYIGSMNEYMFMQRFTNISRYSFD